MSRVTVRKWETGRALPDVQSMLLIANLFGTTIDELVRGDVDEMREMVEKNERRTRTFAVALAAVAIAEEDLLEVRELPGAAAVGCATLESVRAAKVASGREKDALDVAEIDRIGCDPARHARVAGAYAAMRIACVAHGE